MKSNPRIVFRNWMAQQAIEAAEGGDFVLLEKMHSALRDPYADDERFNAWFRKRPAWAADKPVQHALLQFLSPAALEPSGFKSTKGALSSEPQSAGAGWTAAVSAKHLLSALDRKNRA